MKRLIGILATLVLTGMLAGCGASGEAGDSKEKLSVMTTFYPMYDFTKAIVGDEGEVELLIPAGTDSHDYEPSAKDMAKIQDTDIFVYNDENMGPRNPKNITRRQRPYDKGDRRYAFTSGK